VGFVSGHVPEGEEGPADDRIREIGACLDPEPCLPWDLWETGIRMSRSLFCGLGAALEGILPRFFFRDDSLSLVPSPPCPPAPSPEPVECLHLLDDSRRERALVERLERQEGVLLLFPDAESAARLYARLPEGLRSRGLLWPGRGVGLPHWREASEASFVLGGPGALAAPLQRVTLIVLEREESEAWKRRRPPLASQRAIAAIRSRVLGVPLLLAGRIPSARAYLRGGRGEMPSRSRFRVVDPRIAPVRSAVGAVPLPISRPLAEATGDRLRTGESVLWILDRKGFAREVYCADCDTVLRCDRCGSDARSARGRGGEIDLVCRGCGARAPMPFLCPRCGGPILQARVPGVEAFAEAASSLFPGTPVREWSAETGRSRPRRREILAGLEKGGLVVGTRAVLSLRSALRVGLIAWLDADAELRRPEYDARFRALEGFLESLNGVEESCVLMLQSRGTAAALLGQGGRGFWGRELEDRRAMGLPPFRLLLGLRGRATRLAEIREALARSEIDVYEGPPGRTLWASGAVADLRAALSPFFGMGGGGIRIEIRTD
jgi:primosomal protein N' (replication factor Y)